MPRLDQHDSIDPAELRFRMDSIPAGAWVTFIICAAGIAYSLIWDHPHATALTTLFAIGALGGAVVMALPWERIVRSRYRELVFATWSAVDFALILALAALDGGGDSVFAALLVVPIIFAAVSYPRWLVIAISVIVVGGYVVLAEVTDTPGGFTLMLAATLATTAVVGERQAREHQGPRGVPGRPAPAHPLARAPNRRGLQ